MAIQNVRLNPVRYWAMVIAFAVITVAIFFLRTHLGGPIVFGTKLQNGDFLLLLNICYLLASFKLVGTTEWGGVTVLEEPSIEVKAGDIVLAPPGLAKLLRAPRSVQEDQFPGDPEDIQKTTDDVPLQPGKVRPMRIITGAKVEGNDHILNAQMALETIFSVRWSVQGKGFFEFYINIPGNSWDEKLAQIRKQMRDTGEGKLGELYSERTPDSIIAQLGGPEGLNTALEMTLEDAVCKWGITIDEARIQSPDLSHDVSIALASIPAANARKVATIAAAQGEKEKLKLEGEGRGEARKAELAAEGEGLKAAAAAMGLTPAEYFAGQIARDTIGKGTVIFGDGGLAQAMLAGKTMLDAVTNQKEKDKP